MITENPIPGRRANAGLGKLLKVLLILMVIAITAFAIGGFLIWRKVQQVRSSLASIQIPTKLPGATRELTPEDMAVLKRVVEVLQQSRTSSASSAPTLPPIATTPLHLPKADKEMDPDPYKKIFQNFQKGNGVKPAHIQEFLNQLPAEQRMLLEQALKDPQAVGQALRAIAQQQEQNP